MAPMATSCKALAGNEGAPNAPTLPEPLPAIDCPRASYAEAREQQPLGDVSAYLCEIDPYQDGNSADRVGSFLRGFIEELDASHPRDQAAPDGGPDLRQRP